MIPLWFLPEFHFHYTVKMFDEGNDCPVLSYEYIFPGKRFISFTYLISIISVLHKVLTRCYSLRHWTWAGCGDIMFAIRSFRSMLYVHHTQSQDWLTWQFSVSPFPEPSLASLMSHLSYQMLHRKGCEWVQCLGGWLWTEKRQTSRPGWKAAWLPVLSNVNGSHEVLLDGSSALQWMRSPAFQASGIYFGFRTCRDGEPDGSWDNLRRLPVFQATVHFHGLAKLMSLMEAYTVAARHV